MTPNEKLYIEKTPTPQDLIRVGIEELERRENSPKYKIDMGHFYFYEDISDICYICLGGAFLLGAFPRHRKHPIEESNEMRRRRLSLDCFRTGNVHGGLFALGITGDLSEDAFISVADYDVAPLTFKTQMLCLAEFLEEFNFKIKD